MTTLNSHLRLAMLNNNKNKSAIQKGFTLIELLVVVVILGVLSGVALPQLLGAKDSADEKASLASANGMAKECSNWIRFGQATNATAPAYITNDLVLVSTQCGTGGGVFETNKTQNPADGDLCVNTPKLSNQTSVSKCTFTVDTNGGLTGTWN